MLTEPERSYQAYSDRTYFWVVWAIPATAANPADLLPPRAWICRKLAKMSGKTDGGDSGILQAVIIGSIALLQGSIYTHDLKHST